MLRSAVSGGGIKAGACRLRRDGEKLCTVRGGMGGGGGIPHSPERRELGPLQGEAGGEAVEGKGLLCGEGLE